MLEQGDIIYDSTGQSFTFICEYKHSAVAVRRCLCSDGKYREKDLQFLTTYFLGPPHILVEQRIDILREQRDRLLIELAAYRAECREAEDDTRRAKRLAKETANPV